MVLGFVVWGAVEEVQGTPQAARWLASAGVKHGQLLGLLITGLLMLVAVLLLAGPERVQGWFESKPKEAKPALPIETKTSESDQARPKTELVLATPQDAALAKTKKWIGRGERLEARFPKLPTNDEITAMTNAEKKAHISYLGILHTEELRSIGEWHEGVSHDLRAVGGGTLGLYSADEKPSQGMFAIERNREFLRERLQELQGIRSRVEEVARQPERSPSQSEAQIERLPTRLPTITPEAAESHLAEIEALRDESEVLIEGAWNRELKMKRRVGFVVLETAFIEKVTAWNERVHALADKTMSVKERTKVRQFQTPITRSLSGFGITADHVETVISSNLQTLDVIASRCQKAGKA